jgi:hypothetical protein
MAPAAVNVTTPLGAPSPLIPVPANVATTFTAVLDPYAIVTVGVTATVSVAAFTVCPLVSVPVLLAKSLLPAYTACTTWFPALSVELLAEVAEPAESVTGEPKLALSIMNCTVPAGVPVLPVVVSVTIAVNFTA